MIVYLVGVEVRGSDIDVEQVVAAGELQGNGFRQRPGAGLQDIGDVLGAEGLEGEPVRPIFYSFRTSCRAELA
jgi:hypothetical protein